MSPLAVRCYKCGRVDNSVYYINMRSGKIQCGDCYDAFLKEPKIVEEVIDRFELMDFD